MSDDFLEEDDSFFEEWDDDREPFAGGPLRHKYVKSDRYKGVAFFVDGDDAQGNITCHMVGDDRPFYFNTDDVDVLDREQFCGECGQIGCVHDGLERV